MAPPNALHLAATADLRLPCPCTPGPAVLDAGTVREYDTPAALLATPGSAFRGMVEETARHTSHTGGTVQRTASAKALVMAVRGRLSAEPPAE